MALFSNLFKKSVPATQLAVQAILAPVSGEVMDISKVNDPAFASKAMGDGVAIVPSAGQLVAPIDGTVEALFPTGHALAITGQDGLSVMLHIGIDTVDMQGDGFKALVQQGDTVHAGQPLIEFDMKKIEAAGHEATTMVIVASLPSTGSLTTCPEGPVAISDRVIWFE